MSRPNRPATRLLAGLRAALAAGLVVACAGAAAGELYQWKDANGVTHYSDAPPAGQATYQSRSLRTGRTAEPATEAAPAENGQCTTARANLKLLQQEGPVGMDADKDGKPDAPLSAEQRAAQTALAEAAIQVHCTAGAGKAEADADAAS